MANHYQYPNGYNQQPRGYQMPLAQYPPQYPQQAQSMPPSYHNLQYQQFNPQFSNGYPTNHVAVVMPSHQQPPRPQSQAPHYSEVYQNQLPSPVYDQYPVQSQPLVHAQHHRQNYAPVQGPPPEYRPPYVQSSEPAHIHPRSQLAQPLAPPPPAQEFEPPQYQRTQQHPLPQPTQSTKSFEPPEYVSMASIQRQQPQLVQRAFEEVQPNVDSLQPSLANPAQPKPEQQDREHPDYAVLLLTVAEECFGAASTMSTHSDQYYKLMATAMGSLEAVLNNFKLSPLREAQVSLRYAEALYNETDNNDDAERLLTKGIDICERNRLLDLKYAMQLLLSRILYRSRPKAAIKDIQVMIDDVEAYRHVAWEYAFRFQQAVFLASSSSNHDLYSAISQLEKMGKVARQNGDRVVYAFAELTQALLHVRSSNADGTVSAQAALANVRGLQLLPDVERSPQISIMTDFIDLACSLSELAIPQYENKRKHMQQKLYECIENPAWNDDGTVQIPISIQSLYGQQLQHGGVLTQRDGRVSLSFSWLSKAEAESIGYLLCAVSVAHKNASDGGKAEKFIDTGLGVVRAPLEENESSTNVVGSSSSNWQKVMECHLMTERAFLQCSKGQWNLAGQTVKELDSLHGLGGNSLPRTLIHALQYIKGVVLHGTGNITAALKIFESHMLNLTQFNTNASSTPNSVGISHARSHNLEMDTIRNLCILATMNRAFIVSNPDHGQHATFDELLETLHPFVKGSRNKNIEGAYVFLKAISPSNKWLATKSFLGEALKIAQETNNAQIIALTLVMMEEKLFKGAVGDQAMKCARAASSQAKRWDVPLWKHVTAGLEGDVFEIQGRKEDAQRKKQEAQKRIESLPDKIRELMKLKCERELADTI